jgi:hypothetical protein
MALAHQGVSIAALRSPTLAVQAPVSDPGWLAHRVLGRLAARRHQRSEVPFPLG